MAYDSREVANYIVKWHWVRDRKLTHLSLQKILFFCHGAYLARTGEPLVSESFEAWPNGPVIRIVFEAFRSFKDKPIEGLANRYDPVSDARREIECTLNDADIDIVDREISFYSSFTAYELVNQTHAKGTPWDEVWNTQRKNIANLGMRISNDSIKAHFLMPHSLKN